MQLRLHRSPPRAAASAATHVHAARRRAACRRARSFTRTALVTAIIVTAVPLAQSEAIAADGWQRPVGGRVVRVFAEPAARFAPGHRGVDFSAPAGTSVRAANDGRVTFAGDVAGTLHVVLLHSGGIRTTYSFLSRIDVHVGDVVDRGAVVGATGGQGEGHGPDVLHLSARVGERYIDPMVLFEPSDLTELVRLVPTSEIAAAERATPEDEARSIFEPFPHDDDGGGGCGPFGLVCAVRDGIEFLGGLAGDVVQWSWDGVHEAIDAALDAVRVLGAAAAELAEHIGPLLHKLADLAVRIAKDAALRILRSTAWGWVLLAVYHYGKALYDYATQDCDKNAKPANGHGGSGHWTMAVGGLDSSRRKGKPSFGFEYQRLNYKRNDVEWYSYRDESATYSKDDTNKHPLESAALLAEQIKEQSQEHPGQPVDLVGHSQGGVVIRLFLDFYWKGHESDYPPLGSVVFYASPQNGTPLARVAQSLRKTPISPIVPLADALDAPGPDITSDAVEDLSTESGVSRYLASHEVPKNVRVLSIGGSFDVVVPPASTKVKGGRTISVDVGSVSPFDDHSGVLHEDDALAAHRAFIEGHKLPCMDLSDALMGATGDLVLGEGMNLVADQLDKRAITPWQRNAP